MQEKKKKKVITQIYLNGSIDELVSSCFLFTFFAISEIRIYRRKSTNLEDFVVAFEIHFDMK